MIKKLNQFHSNVTTASILFESYDLKMNYDGKQQTSNTLEKKKKTSLLRFQTKKKTKKNIVDGIECILR